jgi:hypothetical protein
MSYFGRARGKPSFFNDPTFTGLDLSGLDPTGLQNAIDANAAASRHGRVGFGESTLGKIIGILGDGALGFVGQPAAYGASVREERERQQKMMEEDERRRRERMERREDMQWQWDNELEDWSIPRVMEQWYEPDVQAAMLPYARARSAMPATQNGNTTREGVWDEFGRPRGLFGQRR